MLFLLLVSPSLDSLVPLCPCHCCPQQEHRDLTDNTWQKLTNIVAEGEGLLKNAKKLLGGWPLPPVMGVEIGVAEMDQLGRCSEAIKVTHLALCQTSEPNECFMHVALLMPVCVCVCTYIPPLLLPSLHPPQNFFCPDLLCTFDSIKDDLLTKIHHTMAPAELASPPPDDPPVLSASTATASPSPKQVSPIHVSLSEDDLERVMLLWGEECQESRWLVDLMDLLSKLVPLRCTAVSDTDRCQRGMEFCGSMSAVEEQLSSHAVSTGCTSCA